MKETRSGHLHPIALFINEVAEIFTKIGFDVNDGPELEEDWYNFEALNFPPNHPAREMQDTFWIKPISPLPVGERSGEGQKNNLPHPSSPCKGEEKLLRTHTSNVQIRTMQEHVKSDKPYPLAMICPGKVYRNEATDATHEAQFYQIEGLYVAKDASIANLKWTMEYFLSEFFKKKVAVRMRSSFFPFVEPGVEFDMSCFKCDGKGCSTCKQSGFIELGGAGMVHPQVLENCGIDSKKYSGFAFGCGIDRILMLRYSIDDIRDMYSGDLRLVMQL
jgi:phenylalanyl-tRNA synthetase alpha chain